MRTLLILAGVALSLVLSADHAQPQGRFREGSLPPRFPPADMPVDGGFSVCRIMYSMVRSEAMGMGWRTDYPYAEVNLMTRLSELTKIPIGFDAHHEPHHFVVRLTDDALFSCPFTVASDVGTAGFSEVEASRLRMYLLKGGFLWVDDFWGTGAWEQWASEIKKVLPEYTIADVPLDDPLFRAFYPVGSVPQITNIQFWRRVGGSTTSERGSDSADAHMRAIRDRHGRIMVLMTHNTDIADAWEREGEDPGFFYQFSAAGYAIGINVVLHALTH